jgi:hypothetical protein
MFAVIPVHSTSPLATALAAAALAAALAVAGCGGSSASSSGASSSKSSSSASGGAASQSSSSSGPQAQPLLGEAQSAATGDIPDSQVFLTFRDSGSRYSMEYPEGWALQGSGRNVTFKSNNNLIRVLVTSGPIPTPAAVSAELARQKQAQPSLTVGPSSTQSINGSPVVKVSYSTQSAPNPVTGKQVLLLVDRYVYAKGGKLATVDLATPKGVDNVDAYKKIAKSFKWQ